jgi:hypothetical protein
VSVWASFRDGLPPSSISSTPRVSPAWDPSVDPDLEQATRLDRRSARPLAQAIAPSTGAPQ